MNWDTETGARINEELAWLMGWTNTSGGGRDMIGMPPNHKRDEFRFLPDWFGSNHDALDAAEWMKERGWNYAISSFNSLYDCDIWNKNNESEFHSNGQEKLSEAIARAMGKALSAEAE